MMGTATPETRTLVTDPCEMPSAQSRKRAFAYLALSGSSSGGQLSVEFRFRLPANLQRVAGRNRFGRKRKQWSAWLNVRVNIVDCSGRRDPRFFLKTLIPARAGTDGRPSVKAAANCLFSKLSNGGPEKFVSSSSSQGRSCKTQDVSDAAVRGSIQDGRLPGAVHRRAGTGEWTSS